MTRFKRQSFVHDGINVAWLALVGSTLFGWWLGHTVQSGQGDMRFAMAGVLVTACVKTWIVGFQFMELRQAPLWLRHGFDVWVVVLCAALLVVCL